jgi:hypothetical protein
MIDEKPEPTTEELVESTAATRNQVAADVERLATELTPARLKHRALDAAEHSLDGLAVRGQRVLARVPRRLAAYLLQHPLVGVAVVVGAAAVTWKVTVGRRR